MLVAFAGSFVKRILQTAEWMLNYEFVYNIVCVFCKLLLSRKQWCMRWTMFNTMLARIYVRWHETHINTKLFIVLVSHLSTAPPKF